MLLGHFMDRPSVVIWYNHLDINLSEITNNKIVLRKSIWILWQSFSFVDR